jgi:hypothetical protein
MAPIGRRALAFFGLIGLGIGLYAYLNHTGPQPRQRSARDRGG